MLWHDEAVACFAKAFSLCHIMAYLTIHALLESTTNSRAMQRVLTQYGEATGIDLTPFRLSPLTSIPTGKGLTPEREDNKGDTFIDSKQSFHGYQANPGRYLSAFM